MITVLFDGLCEPGYPGGPRNPGGVATYGYAIYKDGSSIKKGCRALGEGQGFTNNVAEFSGLKRALEWLAEQDFNDEILIKGDSMLVINQVNGNWQVKSRTSRRFVPEIKKLLQGKKARLQWIPREENSEADMLSRVAYKRYLKNKQQNSG